MNATAIGLASAVGWIVGDLLELPVKRTGAHEPLGRPWWVCEGCGAVPGPSASLPLLGSWFRASGCRECGDRPRLARRPLVMAFSTAVVYGLFTFTVGIHLVLLALSVFGAGIVALSAVDIERRILPFRILYPVLGIVSALLVLASAVDHRWVSLERSAIAGVAAFALMWLVNRMYPAGLGGGDVRLSALIGVTVGWFGLGHAYVAFLAGFLLATLFGAGLALVTGGGRKTVIKFGPFLSLGAVVGIVAGTPILSLIHIRG